MDRLRVIAQLERILKSAEFSGAHRPSTFLRFIVECSLEQRAEQIKESVIAIEAFKRDASFDPKTDPIVRVEAGRLRDRLESYYAGEGQKDALLIHLPKGGYVPRFMERPIAPYKPPDVLTLSIVAPSGSRIDSFAISPDGGTLAFAASLGSEQLLWVRPLDALEARPLPGTEGAAYPFWSPDSRSIGFFAQTKLRRVDAAGGPPFDLADIVVGRGAAWSSSGIILFCPRPLGPLYEVSAEGGQPRVMTSLDSARAEAVHGFPQFLPDGRRFVYLAMSARAGESAVRVTSLDSRIAKTLIHADTSATVARAFPSLGAALLFVSNGTLIAQRLDLDRAETEGDRVVVAKNVRYRRWHQSQVSIADNGLLLYQEGSTERHRFTWINRDGQVTETAGPSHDAISISLSPDERYVAFYRDSDPATVYPKVWATDLALGGAAFRITDNETPEADFTPLWSADGQDILYSRGDDRRMRLMRQPLTGGAAVCLLDSPGPKFLTDTSSDGRIAAYTSQAPDFRFLHVWTAKLDTPSESGRLFLNHAHREANAYFAPGIEAPGPRCLAYSSAETGRDEVYICDFPDGVRKWHVSTNGGVMPHWRDDGRELFYLALDGTLMAVAVTLGSSVEIGAPRALFATGIDFIPQHKSWMNQYAVGHGGERFLINRPTGAERQEITVVVPR